MQHRLFSDLERVADRYRRLYAWTAAAAAWLAAALVALGLFVLARSAGHVSPWAVPGLGVVAVVTAWAAAALAARPARDRRWVARRVESRYPELATLLLTAVEQKPALPRGRLGYLQDCVVRGAVDHGRRHDWEHRVVSPARLRAARAAGLICFGLFIAALALVFDVGRGEASLARRFGVASSASFGSVTVDPGDVEIERGRPLIVTARFAGVMPGEAVLAARPAAQSSETKIQNPKSKIPAIIRLDLAPSLSDPMFGGRLAEVQNDLVYWIEYAGQQTREYRVTVFEFPELVRSDAELFYPAYTGLGEKRIENTRRVTAVEGTKLTLWCTLNKPVAQAWLAAEDGRLLPLAAADGRPDLWSVSFTLTQSARYRLHLRDDRARANREPPEFVVNVVPNRAPEVRVESPARDMRISPLEELDLSARFWDDFGLPAYGLSYSLAGAPEQEVVLGRTGAGAKQITAAHKLDAEALAAQPDQLVSYYFWAEDVGPDGQPRRTLGDMYFAEVRHFEEIFREGEQPAGGQQQQQQQQGGNQQQAEQLAEAQKQIVNATWKLIRRETPKQTDAFTPDVRRVHESQTDVIDQAAALDEKLEDPQSQAHLAAAVEHMQAAADHLAEALVAGGPGALSPALAAEQAAYQALLKLRAREHRVARGNQQQSGQSSSSSSGPSQQQLNQLELKNSENRYETKRTPQEQAADRQTREVLNRLRDLARRQGDLNERLKELESALQAAQTQAEREELERRLKRLREEQEQMLRDADELAQQMDQSGNQERMSDARRQLDQSRERIEDAAQALNENQVPQAVASGTRAERELKELAEDFRKQASGRFADEARELKQEARRIQDKETELGQQLRGDAPADQTSSSSQSQAPPNQSDQRDQSGATAQTPPRPQPKSLRAGAGRDQLSRDFQQQREDLENLLNRMQETVTEAEEAEPLLTEKLYDGLRRARQDNLTQELDAARMLLDRGLADPAAAAEAQAAEGIHQLRQAVDAAAESVLGDETEALRRARDVLDQLADELDQEMRAHDEGRGLQPADEPAVQRGSPADDSSSEISNLKSSPVPPDPAADPPSEISNLKSSSLPPGTSQPRERRSLRPTADSADSARTSGELDPDQSPTQPGEDSPSEISNLKSSIGPQPADRTSRDRTPAPLTGSDYRDWSDRLRDVEDMLDNDELRAEAARIHDAASGIRQQLRGGSKGPSWDIVRRMVAVPLGELRDRVAEELARRGADPTAAVIDRDPVPPRYADQVRRYYERLGRGD